MRVEAFEGVVVRRRDIGEADRIVELLTAEEGRVPLLARGARASRKRFVGALDLFVSLRAQVVIPMRGRLADRLWTLQSADIIDARLGIRRDLDSIEGASLLVECASVLSPERQEAGETYQALTFALDAVARGELAVAASAYPRFLAAAGLMPDLRQCTRCGARNRALASLLRPGEVLCATCAPDRATLPPEVVTALGGGECRDLATAKAVADSVGGLIEAQIGRRLHSRRGGLEPRWP